LILALAQLTPVLAEIESRYILVVGLLGFDIESDELKVKRLG